MLDASRFLLEYAFRAAHSPFIDLLEVPSLLSRPDRLLNLSNQLFAYRLSASNEFDVDWLALRLLSSPKLVHDETAHLHPTDLCVAVAWTILTRLTRSQCWRFESLHDLL